MPVNVLIVSHLFPPVPGIGARRWAKFAKYLTKKNFQVHVLTADHAGKSGSVWTNDVKNISIEKLPFNFPEIIAYPKPGVVNKMKYFLMLEYLKLKDKGNFYDKTIFWKNQLEEKIQALIKQNNIKCVIVTAGPFRLANYVIGLKKKFPEVKFIVDFRDLWTNDSEITAFSKMSETRKNYERQLEKETLELADKVICVADNMKTYFGGLTSAQKITVIPNGFDTDDFSNVIGSRPAESDGKIKFVFTGTLYINLEYILEPFFRALGKLKAQNKNLFGILNFEFIGTFPDAYKQLITKYNISESITISKSLPLKEVYKHINESDYCMLFLNNVYNFALSTKFCEYISQRKKIIVVSSKGQAQEFIVNKNIGFWINPENTYEDLKSLIEKTISGNVSKWNSDFNVEEFSLNNLTDKLINLIEQ
jgi:glycosyltransferase involved in cell wall biosynthesis